MKKYILLFAVIFLALSVQAQNVFGPPAYRNGFGMGDGSINGSGTVTTNGSTTVTWASGAQFQTNGAWNGTAFTIGGTQFTVQIVSSPTSLIVTSSIGMPTGTETYASVGYRTRTNALCVEGTLCQDPDFPLGGPGPASTMLPSATHTVYSTVVGPQWMMKAWLLDTGFTSVTGSGTTSGTTLTWTSGTKFTAGLPWAGSLILLGATQFTVQSWTSTTVLQLVSAPAAGSYSYKAQAGAANISAQGAADSTLNVISYDQTAFCFDTSLGGRGWFSSYNPLTGTATPLYEMGITGKGGSFGGGVCEFSKVPVTDASMGTNNQHVAYVYCVAPNNPGLCEIDPYTGTIKQLVDINAIGNFPTSATDSACQVGGEAFPCNPSGTGGEIDCTRDLLGAGIGTVCMMSIGVTGEVENAWRYTVSIWMANFSVLWYDMKRDVTGGSTSPAFPNIAALTCSTPAVTQGLCTGYASAPSSDVALPYCSPSGTLISCPGIHGIAEAVDYQNNVYTNISFEDICHTVGGCTVGGSVFFSNFGTAPTAALSSVLNGAGHRGGAGAGTFSLASTLPCGTIFGVGNQAVSTQWISVPSIGCPPTDGHDTGNATDNVGTALNSYAGHGMLGFGSFYNGTTSANSIVGNGTTATITCIVNPCFPQSVPETTVTISNSSHFNGTWNVVGATGIGSNQIVISNPTNLTDSGGNYAIQTNSCQDPTAPGMDEYIFYSVSLNDLDSNGSQRNSRVMSTKMDTCANNLQFYNLVNGNVDAKGQRLLMPTNLNCSLGANNIGNCLLILQMAELVPASTCPTGKPCGASAPYCAAYVPPSTSGATLISSLPFNITAPGNYYLNSSLSSTTNGIYVTYTGGSPIDINLNGFTLTYGTSPNGSGATQIGEYGLLLCNTGNLTVENLDSSYGSNGQCVSGGLSPSNITIENGTITESVNASSYYDPLNCPGSGVGAGCAHPHDTIASHAINASFNHGITVRHLTITVSTVDARGIQYSWQQAGSGVDFECNTINDEVLQLNVRSEAHAAIWTGNNGSGTTANTIQYNTIVGSPQGGIVVGAGATEVSGSLIQYNDVNVGFYQFPPNTSQGEMYSNDYAIGGCIPSGTVQYNYIHSVSSRGIGCIFPGSYLSNESVNNNYVFTTEQQANGEYGANGNTQGGSWVSGCALEGGRGFESKAGPFMNIFNNTFSIYQSACGGTALELTDFPCNIEAGSICTGTAGPFTVGNNTLIVANTSGGTSLSSGQILICFLIEYTEGNNDSFFTNPLGPGDTCTSDGDFIVSIGFNPGDDLTFVGETYTLGSHLLSTPNGGELLYWQGQQAPPPDELGWVLQDFIFTNGAGLNFFGASGTPLQRGATVEWTYTPTVKSALTSLPIAGAIIAVVDAGSQHTTCTTNAAGQCSVILRQETVTSPAGNATLTTTNENPNAVTITGPSGSGCITLNYNLTITNTNLSDVRSLTGCSPTAPAPGSFAMEDDYGSERYAGARR